MVTLHHAAGGFRLAKALPDAVVRELRDRELAQPAWDPGARAWTYTEDDEMLAAVRFLVETRAVAPDALADRRLRELAQERMAPTLSDRMQELEDKLRPYQREGVGFALARKRILLADAMGLGKSLQALVAVEKANAYPAVVVCPAAVKLGWANEVLKWVPWRSVQAIQPGDRAVRKADLTVVNPELLPRHLEDLKALKPRALILDEAHFFKNPGSQRSKNALELAQGVPLRMALTGTPIKNRREDLVHQLRILGQLDEVLLPFKAVLPHWYKPSMGPLAEPYVLAAVDQLPASVLNQRLKETCMIRRTKQEVARDLPPLGRTRVEVTPGHLQAYREREEKMLEWVRKWQETFGKQAVDAARLDKGSAAGLLEFRGHLTALRREAALAKIPAVKDWVEPLVESGERVVFFAYHRDVVDKLAKALPGDVAEITGDTPAPARRAILDALDKKDFLVATMDSTGYGVDGIQLHASHVAFIELDWTPTKHEQCEGRLHRIGQTSPVNSWYFVATNTLDRVVMDVLDRKWSDIQGVVEGQVDDAAFIGDLLRQVASGKDSAHLETPKSPV